MYCAAINRDSIWEHEGDVDIDVDIEAMTIVVKKNNALFFYVLYPDKTCVFDQSEHVQGWTFLVFPWQEKKNWNLHVL